MSWYQISVAKEKNRYIFFWWLVSYSQIALCGTKFDTYCAKINFTQLKHLKEKSREKHGKIGKSWQKMAKVGKKLQKLVTVAKSCQKLPQIGKNAKIAINFLQSTHRRPPFTLPATLPVTRIFFYYPTRTLPEVKKPYPSQPAYEQGNPWGSTAVAAARTCWTSWVDIDSRIGGRSITIIIMMMMMKEWSWWW